MDSINSENELQDSRREALQGWFLDILPALSEQHSDNNSIAKPSGHEDFKTTEIQPLSGDASFRRYFISHFNEHPYVLVDAPPEKEDNRSFVQIAEKFLNAGINVPEVYAVDFDQGFLCLSFLGDSLLWEKLDALKQSDQVSEAGAVYQQAMQILLIIQGIKEGKEILLPPFDSSLLLTEMNLFREWFCGGLMGLDLSPKDNELLDHFFELLIESALSQPQVCVHRDFHSRNLMVDSNGNLGVIDFQDAVIGPFTYDLVSLIKDCYIIWPKDRIREWALQYARMANSVGIIDELDEAKFLFQFDLMGLQRHLKAVGIFSRLYLRDGKQGYLADIPRTLAYVKEVMSEYDDLSGVGKWFETKIYPLLVTRLNAVANRKHDL